MTDSSMAEPSLYMTGVEDWPEHWVDVPNASSEKMMGPQQVFDMNAVLQKPYEEVQPYKSDGELSFIAYSLARG